MKIQQSTTYQEFQKLEHLTANALNSRFSTIYNDIKTLVANWNNFIYPIEQSLKDGNLQNNNFDGTNILVDKNATSSDNGGLLYDPDADKPATIKDAILTIMQTLAFVDNGMKEGIKIDNITLAASGTYSINNIIFSDNIYVPYVFNSNDGSPADVSYTCINGEITITNNDTVNPITIYGYIWHPVFTF